jgi:hypothetical protein
MTESEWLSYQDPREMLLFLWTSGKASARKLRLFGCACCRRIWRLLTDEPMREAVEVAEWYADGLVSKNEMAVAAAAAYRAVHERPLMRLAAQSFRPEWSLPYGPESADLVVTALAKWGGVRMPASHEVTAQMAQRVVEDQEGFGARKQEENG